MSAHHNKITTYTQQSQTSKSRMRVSRLDQQIDDMHVVIQSSSPVPPHHPDNQSRSRKQNYQTSKYYIHIDEDDGSNFDLTLKLGARQQHPHIKYNNKHLTQPATRPTHNNYYNQYDQMQSQSGNQQRNQPKLTNDFRKTQNLTVNRRQEDDHRTKQQNQISERPSKQNRVTTTETRHIIKIIDGRYDNSNYWSAPNDKRVDNYVTSSFDQQRYYGSYHNKPSQIHQNMTYSFKKQRQQKSFGHLNSQLKNIQGKIIKNGDTKKNIKQEYDQTNYNNDRKLNNNQYDYTNIRDSNINNLNSSKQKKEIQDYIPQCKNDHNKIPIKIQTKPKTQMYFSQNQNDALKITEQKQKKGQKDQKQQRQNNYESKKVKTPSKNYLNSTNFFAQQQQYSPLVYNYRNEEIPEGDDVGPIFVKQTNSPKNRNKIFKNNKSELNKRNSIQEDFDHQRRAPNPYDSEITIQKAIQRQILNQPPSITEIPAVLTNSKQKKKQKYDRSKNNQKLSDSPIVVPISRLPNQSPRKYQSMLSTNRKSIPDKSGLNSFTRDRVQTQAQAEDSFRQTDIFTINKRKYLDKLRRQQKSRSRLQQSRTLSRRNKPALSPECSRITNRLHNTPINKQPCPKFVRSEQRMQRVMMKQTLGEYTFIRRYLSDRQIYEILAEFQRLGVPERKWPMKLVDIVYDKLKVMKSY